MTAIQSPLQHAAITPIPGGGILAVPGLRTAAVASGVKPEGQLDLGVLVADAPLTAAGVFTRNEAAAAPVEVCRRTLARRPAAQVVVINSGNANALTGEEGLAHAEAMQAEAERLFGGPALVLSTGVIGVPLPIQQILEGLQATPDLLGRAPGPFAQAMLTTDTGIKQHAVQVELADGQTATVGGVAKGSGMIHPNMATMLAVIATDAPVAPRALDGVLRRVVDETFHQITIDGDTSTNDAVLLLAGGGSQETVDAADPRLGLLEQAILQVAASLAEQIVADGEGATKTLQVTVTGAAWPGDARRVAHSVAGSSLVKTALYGGDPNWGRIIAAAGNAGVKLDLQDLVLEIGGQVVFSEGSPAPRSEQAAAAAFSQPRVEIALDLGAGDEDATVLTSDLTPEYVAINAHYRT